MAQVVRKPKWLAVEETLSRDAYWRMVVDEWLWQVPYAVVTRSSERNETVPSPEALRHFGWVKEPQSQLSH